MIIYDIILMLALTNNYAALVKKIIRILRNSTKCDQL